MEQERSHSPVGVENFPPPSSSTQRASRAEIMAAKEADEQLTQRGVPVGDPERSRFRRDGETGRYITRKSRKTRRHAQSSPPPNKQWVWFARAAAFRGKTVGEWRAEAAREGGSLRAKYRLLTGNDDDLIVRGSREDVYYERAHITNTSARMIRADLALSKKGEVVSRTKSDHSKRMLAKKD